MPFQIITPEEIATGQPVDSDLMSKIKVDFDDHEGRILITEQASNSIGTTTASLVDTSPSHIHTYATGTNVQDQLDNVDLKLVALVGSDANLQATLAAAIFADRTRLTDIEAKDVVQDSSLNTHGSQIADLIIAANDQSAINTNQAVSIDAHTVSINSLASNDAIQDTAIAGHTTDIASLGTSLSTLETTVGSHTTDIGSLNTTVTQHSTDISTLQTNVTTLQNTPAGGGSGVGSVDILSADQAESAVLADYIQTDAEILSSGVLLHGTKTFRLQHINSIKSLKKIIPVDRKFRGKNLTVTLDALSTATSGNLNILFYDETNAANLAVSQPIPTNSQAITATTANGSANLVCADNATFNLLKVGMLVTGSAIPLGTTILSLSLSTKTATLSALATGVSTSIRISDLPSKKTFSFNVPENCSSLSWQVSTIVETYALSYIDDIVIQLTSQSLSSTNINLPIDVTPTTTKFLSGSGIYYTPANTKYIRVRMVGGGAGGSGGDAGRTAGGSGGDTTFGTSLLVAGGGQTSSNPVVVGTGGIASLGTATGTAIVGGVGEGSQVGNSSIYVTGGSGASTPFGAGGTSRGNTGSGAGVAPAANTGAGGGGGTGFTTVGSGTGGAAGGYVDAIITSPSSSYSYTVGAAGTAGGGTIAGSIGGSGYIEITEYRTSTTSTAIPLTTTQLVQQPDSSLMMTGGTLSGNVSALDFSNIAQNVGSAIKYDNATKRFIALEAGIFIATVTDESATAAQNILSISANVSGVNIGLSEDDNASSQYRSSASGTVYLNVNDYIYFSASNSRGTGGQRYCSIAKQGSLKQLNPSSDSKITIPTHQLVFIGANTRGTGTNNAILNFGSQTQVKGDAFSVDSSNGSILTIKKAGKLDINTTMYTFGTGMKIVIEKNPTVYNAQSGDFLAIESTTGTDDTLSASWSGDVIVGDKIAIYASVNPYNFIGNSVNFYLTETSIPANFSNVLPQWSQSDSSIRVWGGNGYGSVNTLVRRFANNPDNIGSAIKYFDSATLGSYCEVQEEGLYDVGYGDNVSSAAVDLYIAKNSTGIPVGANILAEQRANSTYNVDFASCSNQVYLFKGDVVRCINTTASGLNNGVGGVYFSISKVGKPNLTSVDVTPFVNMKTIDTEEMRFSNNDNGAGSTYTAYRKFTSVSKTTNKGILKYVQDSIYGDYVEALKDCNLVASYSGPYSNAGGSTVYIVKNASSNTPSNDSGLLAISDTPAGNWGFVATTASLRTGDKLRFGVGAGNVFGMSIIQITATADNDTIATPTQQISSDTIPFVFKATAIDPNTDPIGTYNTYSYAAGTNNATMCVSKPSTDGGQTEADMNLNGFRITARSYNANSTVGNPTRVNIFIGKGLASEKVRAYFGAGKTSHGPFDYSVINSTTEYGTTYSYSELTGILEINAGAASLGTNTVRYAGTTGGPSAYFTFNASKAPIITTIPSQQTKWQRKNSTLALNATGYITDLAFNNLTIGKTYRITGTFRFTLGGVTDPGCQVAAYNSTNLTNLIAVAWQHPAGGTNYQTNVINALFTATDSSLRFYYTDGASENLMGADTFAILEELPNHLQTTQWT